MLGIRLTTPGATSSLRSFPSTWETLGISFGLIVFLSVSACGQFQQPRSVTWKARAVQEYPHDPNAFTQGLVIADGVLYEGTGQKGASSLRKVDLQTGTVEKSIPLDARYFGEGITILDGKIYQLTWEDHFGLIYDLESFQFQEIFRYPGEGWGLTHNGKELILSDGTSVIRFLDPKTFREVRRIQVRDQKRNRLKNLNELEYVEGEIWANIWYEDRIARISPETGMLLGWIDVSTIYPRLKRDREAVLNGIAYDPARKKIYVTGKNWPKLYEIEIEK